MALKIGPVAPSHCCSPPGSPFQLLPNFHSMVNFELSNTWLSPSGFSLSTTTAWSPGSCHASRSNLLKTSKYRNDKQLWSRPHHSKYSFISDTSQTACGASSSDTIASITQFYVAPISETRTESVRTSSQHVCKISDRLAFWLVCKASKKK